MNAQTPVNEKATFLIVGLGNPGREYRGSRHNIGFRVVDHLAEKMGTAFSRLESKALVAKGEIESRHIILAKPQTYMNLSGKSVGALVRFYKVPLKNLLVIYDDVDLPYETLRMRPGGGSAGQKGMQSIIENLGSPDFPRLRVGVGRPPGQMQAADYVLQDFSKAQLETLPFLLERATEAVVTFASNGIDHAMNKYNQPLEAS